MRREHSFRERSVGICMESFGGSRVHMIGARASPGCELCKSARKMDWITTDALPVAHIQSAGCKAQKKSVIGAHNRCWKYLISTHGEAKRILEFIGGDKDRQLKHLWEETRIGDILPWMKSRSLSQEERVRQPPHTQLSYQP
jgi:hypothetical protein